MDKQKDRTVVVEFWDIASPHSMRTLPYLMEWHERYATKGLRVIGVHTSAMPQTEDEAVIEAAVERLGIQLSLMPSVIFGSSTVPAAIRPATSGSAD